MSDEDTKVTIEEPKTRKPEVSSADEGRLAHLLSSIQSGWKVSINRVQPSWCKGHLETVEIFDDSDQIDTEYLKRTWGGQRLHLKIHNERGEWIGGGSISMFSFPPMVHGKVIRIEDLQANMPTPQGNPALGIPPQAPPPPAQPQIDINHLFEMMQGTKHNDLQLALQLLEKSKVQNAPPANQIGDMVNQMMGMFTLFGQMKEIFGQNLGDAPAGGGEETMIPVIGDLIKGLLNRNQPQQAPMMMPARRGALAPPRAQPSPAPAPPQPPKAPQSGGDNLSSLAGKLADLSPTDASEVLLEALGNMPEDRRSAAMQHFFTNMAGEDLLDDSSFDDDNYDDDEATQDNQTPNPGKQVQPNGGDGSRNR